ncbi:hypothetical protein [Caldalkalibacillus mannanilyticus]|uniref:hypothetical protein n=1 Tax=Caldalkalibacillus mannanilyticus TaxID=1418 RepID=UPI00046AB4CE|nr:hypothetical protein [Caldalkalibacillus mannanilyticus]
MAYLIFFIFLCTLWRTVSYYFKMERLLKEVITPISNIKQFISNNPECIVFFMDKMSTYRAIWYIQKMLDELKKHNLSVSVVDISEGADMLNNFCPGCELLKVYEIKTLPAVYVFQMGEPIDRLMKHANNLPYKAVVSFIEKFMTTKSNMETVKCRGLM